MTDWHGKKLCAEAEARLNNVFGRQYRFKHAVKAEGSGLQRALTGFVCDESLEIIRGQLLEVDDLINYALCKGLGKRPAGWSFVPGYAAQHELIIWVHRDGDPTTIAKEADNEPR